MSRVEKKIEKNLKKRYKRKKLRIMSKILFIMCMTLNLFICIYIVDSSAKNLLGEKPDYDKVNIKEIKLTINSNIESLNKYIVNIIEQFNK